MANGLRLVAVCFLELFLLCSTERCHLVSATSSFSIGAYGFRRARLCQQDGARPENCARPSAVEGSYGFPDARQTPPNTGAWALNFKIDGTSACEANDEAD